MIAFVLHELGRDPAWLVGALVPQLGGNAGGGDGWLVAEGDESDRTLEALRPKIAVLTNVDLDHHTTFASRREVEQLFESFLAAAAATVRGEELEPYAGELAVEGEHNRRNAATALAALELAGVDRLDAERLVAEFHGAGRRLERRGEAGGVEVFDDYAHHPVEIAAAISALRGGGGRSDGCLRGTRGSRRRRRRQADRRRAHGGPAGDADRLDAQGRGRRPLLTRACTERRSHCHARRRRRRRRGSAPARRACVKIEKRVPLSRYTTIGTGGPARAFARPETLQELRDSLAWARVADLAIATLGLGSNLLVADD